MRIKAGGIHKKVGVFPNARIAQTAKRRASFAKRVKKFSLNRSFHNIVKYPDFINSQSILWSIHPL